MLYAVSCYLGDTISLKNNYQTRESFQIGLYQHNTLLPLFRYVGPFSLQHNDQGTALNTLHMYSFLFSNLDIRLSTMDKFWDNKRKWIWANKTGQGVTIMGDKYHPNLKLQNTKITSAHHQ